MASAPETVPMLATAAAENEDTNARETATHRMPPIMLIDTLTTQGYCTVHTSTGPFRLYYELHGHGPQKVLFVAGSGASLLSWRLQIDHFASQPEYQVCAYDARGVGWSDAPPGLYTTTDMASDALCLLDTLPGWNRDVHAVGCSMGGMVLQEIAIRDPTRFTTLAFLSTSPGRVLFPWRTTLSFLRLCITFDFELRVRRATSLFYPADWLRQTPAPESEGHRLRLASNFLYIRHFLKAWLPYIRYQPLTGVLGHLSAVLRHRVTAARLRPAVTDHPPMRSLVLVGTNDKVAPPQDSLLLASYLQAPVYVFSGSGHILAVEQTRRLNAILHCHFMAQPIAITPDATFAV
ncbi:hypothetical protein H4R34_003984 [Dimargaris verticillata]|uniref:AB hydrolase-1 domain-containing protein n=1 Tax=Dimargaris verticillata TaxID=2761393 RepID=A0A9W8B567_9FUNG|nr:hypothetical protein H4R34_003984 [Dimargaris verticillata]